MGVKELRFFRAKKVGFLRPPQHAKKPHLFHERRRSGGGGANPT